MHVVAQRPSSSCQQSPDIYLRAEAKIELLCARWYAWHHLISPVQRAMNLAYRHIPLMESFIADPSLHIAASKDPKLLGGPFVDLTEEAIPGIKELLRETQDQCSHLLSLAKDIKDVALRIQTKAMGAQLDEFYYDLPETLQGIVEFSYNVNGNAIMRIREELLYEDARFGKAFQEVCLYLANDDERKFFINTPRVDHAEHQAFLAIPFTDQRIDFLASLRIQPQSWDCIESTLGSIICCDEIKDYFTDLAPLRRFPHYDGDAVRVRYFGHACVLLQTSQTSILIDPRLAFQRDNELATLTFADLPDFIDIVVLSHNHQDHFCAETLVQLRGRIGQIVIPQNQRGSIADPSMKLTLKALGFDCITSLDNFESIDVVDGAIVSLPFPGEHCDLEINSKHCVSVTLKEKKFLFLVDSDAVDPHLYRRISGWIRGATALFIGMECHGAPLTWLYGPILTKAVSRNDDKSRRANGSNFERAMSVIHEANCPQVFIYAMGMEPWNNHLLGLEYAADSIQIIESSKLVAACKARGIEAERLKGCREWIY